MRTLVSPPGPPDWAIFKPGNPFKIAATVAPEPTARSISARSMTVIALATFAADSSARLGVTTTCPGAASARVFVEEPDLPVEACCFLGGAGSVSITSSGNCIDCCWALASLTTIGKDTSTPAHVALYAKRNIRSEEHTSEL